MATYKVIQDIEAEDKLVGPLTLKQFIYAIIVAVMGFVAFKLAMVKWFLALPFLPPMVLFGILAAPLGRDQPTEIWLLAKIRFLLKPRKRVWNQSGMQELVTITAPKKIERHLTNNLSQTEVKSRLKALASTIDSRGWAVKNVNINLYAQPAYALEAADTDRLIDPSVLPNDVPGVNVLPADDMLDTQNNPVAQQLDQMITQSAQTHRSEVLEHMKEVQEQQNETAKNPITEDKSEPWFMNQHEPGTTPPGYTTFSAQTVGPGAADDDLPALMRKKSAGIFSDEEKKLLEKLHRDKAREKRQRHRHVLEPEDLETRQKNTWAQNAKATMTPTPDPAILNLANRDDLTVATIARQANQDKKEPPQDEVVVSLR